MSALLLGAGRDRARMSYPTFIGQLKAILGDTRFLWVARTSDTTTSTSDDAGARTITWDASVASRLSALGGGAQQTFASASTQYGTTPDTANLSFGNGLVDQAFSVVVLTAVTDTAADRTIVSKYNTPTPEWLFRVDSTDVLMLFLQDASLGVFCYRRGNTAATQGSVRLLGASYDGTGGATAANGIALYQDGTLVASTATNAGTYVSMEDTAAALEIGSDTAHTGALFNGSMSLVAICQKNLSAADHAQIVTYCRQFYGVPT